MAYDYYSARIHDLEGRLHSAQCRIEELEEQQVEAYVSKDALKHLFGEIKEVTAENKLAAIKYIGAKQLERYIRDHGMIREGKA